MGAHPVPAFHAYDGIPPAIIAALFITASSLLKEPARRNFNAIMIAGAGAAYLSGGFGVWEFVFCAVVTYCAFRGLSSYRFIAIGWLLHTTWDVLHHFYGKSDRSVRAPLLGRMRDHRRARRHLAIRRRSFVVRSVPWGKTNQRVRVVLRS